MNYTVHALMYTYYAFRALQFRIPKWTMMTITVLQLLQMVVGCGLTVFTYKVHQYLLICLETPFLLRWASTAPELKKRFAKITEITSLMQQEIDTGPTKRYSSPFIVGKDTGGLLQSNVG